MKDTRQMIPLLVSGLIGVAVAIGFAVRDEKEWSAYKVEHECVLTGEDRHITVYGGRAPQTVHQYEWDCGDGEEHWHR